MHQKHIKLIIKYNRRNTIQTGKVLGEKRKGDSQETNSRGIRMYDFNKPITDPTGELLGTEERMPAPGMMNQEEMVKLIDRFSRSKLINMREILLCNLFRTELLKALKYPGISHCISSGFSLDPCQSL